jgi:hypothetical protein
MKRFFARNTVLAQQQSQQDLSRKALAGLTGPQTARFFASSPQANPYNSILTKLSVGSNQFSYYKLPALGDKRIGKYLPYKVILLPPLTDRAAPLTLASLLRQLVMLLNLVCFCL